MVATLTDRDSLVASIAYQHRLLEQYSELVWRGGPDFRYSGPGAHTVAEYQRFADAACRREWELKQELERLDAHGS
jgi:hypothetical protein